MGKSEQVQSGEGRRAACRGAVWEERIKVGDWVLIAEGNYFDM
jgi:hypothetical protein